MDKNTRFDLNLSKWMAISLVVLFTGLIVQTASASPKYRSFILSWIDPEPADGQSCVSYASGRLLEPYAFDQGIWKSPGNIKTLREGGIHPVCKLGGDKNYQGFLLAGSYLIVLFRDDVHRLDIGYNSAGASDKIQEILRPHLPSRLFIEAMHFEQQSFSQSNIHELYQLKKGKSPNINPPIVLGYVGGVAEITHWLPFMQSWNDWSTTLETLLQTRDNPSVKAFFSVFDSLPPQEQSFVLLDTNYQRSNRLHVASAIREADIVSTLISACPVESRTELMMAVDGARRCNERGCAHDVLDCCQRQVGHTFHELNVLQTVALKRPKDIVQIICEALIECNSLDEALNSKKHPAELCLWNDHSKEVFPLLMDTYNAPFSRSDFYLNKTELGASSLMAIGGIGIPFLVGGAALGVSFAPKGTRGANIRKSLREPYRSLIWNQSQREEQRKRETRTVSQPFQSRRSDYQLLIGDEPLLAN